MIDVNVELTQKVAGLARLDLSKEEVTQFTDQLKKILGYIEQLNEVNVPADVKPIYSPLEFNAPLRSDVAHAGELSADGKPKVLTSAPEALYDGFKVPPIL